MNFDEIKREIQSLYRGADELIKASDSQRDLGILMGYNRGLSHAICVIEKLAKQ